MTDKRKRQLKRQLQESRYRLLRLNAEFAAPLREMLFVATKEVRRISTNGSCIYFDPDWLSKLGHTELDFMLSHELMHVALGHIDRPKYFTGDRFHLACDIVANSHLELLGWEYDKLPHVGRIFHETFFPALVGRTLTAQEALNAIPFDPATMPPGQRRNHMIDSEEWWERKQDRGETGVIVLCPDDEDPEDLRDETTVGGAHFFVKKELFRGETDEKPEEIKKTALAGQRYAEQSWDKRAANEIEILRNMKTKTAHCGTEDNFVERVWQRTNDPTLDWRQLLNSFVEEEVCDYSFTPPDRRRQDSDFYLPDYCEMTDTPKQVLFLVDTSGSVTDTALSAVYAEICGALAQYGSGLSACLGFFDMQVYTPVPFSGAEELVRIVPRGGGGTDYRCIFDYVESNMGGHLPSSLVIFTDGKADFPDASVASRIPVLWLFSDRLAVAPWGKSAYVGNGE